MASVLAEVVVLASLSGRFDSNLEFKKTASSLADKEVLRSYYESRYQKQSSRHVAAAAELNKLALLPVAELFL